MAGHWLKDFDGLLELQRDYDEELETYRSLKRDGKREEAREFRISTLDALGEELFRAQDHWRRIGEFVDDDHPGKRVGVKTVDFVDDDGNGIDDRLENQ